MIFATLLAAVTLQIPPPHVPGTGELICIPPGAQREVMCALKKTEVDADIEGFGARVTVVQTFRNPSTTPVEAVYRFPLPNDAAIDRMRIQVGKRVIEGELKKREDAQAIYQAAKNAGQTAALLDQERANIFTQSIANLTPGAEVKVEISYVEMLKYEAGKFEFSFPMTIGPRYMGASTPDPDKISTTYAPKGTRTGNDIDVRVHIAAGAPIQELSSVLHKIRIQRDREGRATVDLAKNEEIPNRDFILRYAVATDSVQSAFLTHYTAEWGGYFSLILLPPKAPDAAQIAPKEMIFVMDQSGSQSGFPIEKSKELTLKLIDKLMPGDTFNVMGFSNTVNRLWPSPRPNNAANRKIASDFVKTLDANGGTELHKAVIAALAPEPDPRRLRYVVFNTDGYVGQDKEIIDNIKRFRGTSRLFAFGIGNNVNRDLIDSMSVEGRGDSTVVTLAETADEAVSNFVRRTTNPILLNVSVDCAEATELTPNPLPDVLSDKPIIVFGRYSQPGKARLNIRGTLAGKPWTKTLDVDLPARNGDATAISSLWARRKVDDIQRDGYQAGLRGETVEPVKDRVLKVALEHGIMSPYTSFVAVERRVVNVGGHQRTVNVPLEAPDGVNMGAALGIQFGQSTGGPGSSFRGGAGGVGGGGFGGPATAGAPLAAPALRRAQESKPDMLAAAADKSTQDFMVKVAASLRKVAKGEVAVQIGLTDLKPETLEKLKRLGFKLDVTLDDMRIAVGKIDVKQLKELASLTEVKSVGPDI